VAAVEAPDVITTTGLVAFLPDWFRLGFLTFTSGALSGRRYEVLRHEVRASDVRLQLVGPVLTAPAPGDQFEVRAGCDKAFDTCREKFANTDNHRGFPHTPRLSTILYAWSSEPNTGAALE